jgi:small-conductance mechanosensitive channel
MRSGSNMLCTLVRSETSFALILHNIKLPGKWVCILLILHLCILELPKTAMFIAILRNISALPLIACSTWLGIRFVIALGQIFTQRCVRKEESDEHYTWRIGTQARVLVHSLVALMVVLGVASVLMIFPNIRHIGASLFASAGVVGVIAGIAARPILSNLVAGLQIALTQLIKVGDMVMIEEEVGTIEEITGSYVVICIWDQRRIIVPLQWFIENAFENWTRTGTQVTGTILLWVDYRMDLNALRKELLRLCKTAPEWDGILQILQVVDANENAMQLRISVSTADASQCWNLRCRIREGVLKFIQGGACIM